ncbi:GNAT family N-acetyltransferase [Paenibacillus sp. 2TAB26]|uniref:GNAT family N-acetyltransferase n=1 Tax=Paenibacillus sp. 2TAB26 TaxID=3233005 RepID=UPI003F955238
MTAYDFVFPELETERLRLSILTLEDSEAIYKHFSDENVTRFMDINPCEDLNEAKEIIQYHIDDKGCRWGIFSKKDHRLVGTCGFHCWVQGEQPKAEIGFDLAKEYWGMGLMQEALLPVIAFGFEQMGLSMIEATVEQQNEKSIQLLNRLHFEKEAELRDELFYYYLNRTI